MNFTILITDRGKHSDEQFASVVAEQIVSISAKTNDHINAIYGRELIQRIINIMKPCFRNLANFEHSEMAAKGTAHLAAEKVPHSEILTKTVAEVIEAVKESPFSVWPEVKAEEAAGFPYIYKVIGLRMWDAQKMHRGWFAKGKIGHHTELADAPNYDPNCPYIKDWYSTPSGFEIHLNRLE